VANGSEVVEARANGEADRDDWKIASSGSPLEIMFPSNNIID
jgi:hypothetical protein